MELVVKSNAITTVANTDILAADYTFKTSGVIHIAAVSTASAGDLRITLDGTTYSTCINMVDDVWEVINIPVERGDTFNIQTVAIETLSLRVLFEEL